MVIKDVRESMAGGPHLTNKNEVPFLYTIFYINGRIILLVLPFHMTMAFLHTELGYSTDRLCWATRPLPRSPA